MTPEFATALLNRFGEIALEQTRKPKEEPVMHHVFTPNEAEWIGKQLSEAARRMMYGKI